MNDQSLNHWDAVVKDSLPCSGPPSAAVMAPQALAMQIGAAVGVAAVGSVFFIVLGNETTPGAYGNAFAR